MGLVIEARAKNSLSGNKTVGFACAMTAANTDCHYRSCNREFIQGILYSCGMSMHKSYLIVFIFYMEGSHNIELCVKHTYISLILADASG